MIVKTSDPVGLVKKLFYNAYLAAAGNPETHTLEEVFAAVHTYKKNRFVGDEVFGRRVYLKIVIDKLGDVKINTVGPRVSHQSWVTKYPSIEALVESCLKL